MSPTVSVMMPCFNARPFIPLAVSSILQQSFYDWELVVVDDGSTDGSAEVLQQANDPRIRIIQYSKNRGRGFARNMALEASQGQYLCMLDADDWLYPSRLEEQVQALAQHADVTLVSAGMAIVDPNNDLVGVRGVGDGIVHGPINRFSFPVAHAPSMYRRESAENLRFDEALIRGQDQDFLFRLLWGKKYLVLPSVHYVYSEIQSATPEKLVQSQRYSRMISRKYLGRFPLQASGRIVSSLAKEALYRGAARVGKSGRMVKSRSSLPTEHQVEEFLRARNDVQAMRATRFG